MKRITLFLIYIILINLAVTEKLFAQLAAKDSSDSIAISKALYFFKTTIKQQSGLYNGPAYYTYGKEFEGSASFADSALVHGKVIYNGNSYQNVLLNYDLYLEKLYSVSGGNLFSLVSEKITEFSINNHRFINIEQSKLKGSPMAAGFYDLIYDGSFKILAKRLKKLEFSTSQETAYFFKTKTTYFLERNQQYQEINGESSFLDLFKDKKNELKKQLGINNIKYKKDPEQAMIIMATYYDNLKK